MNISYDGCHILAEDELEVGEALNLSVDAMSVIEAQVRWVDGGRSGLKFVTGASAVDARRARIGV